MKTFVIAVAARLAAENYIGRPCAVLNCSAKLGVAYEIVCNAARIALVYIDGRVSWQNTEIPCGFNSRMEHAMYQLMPVARRVAASW